MVKIFQFIALFTIIGLINSQKTTYYFTVPDPFGFTDQNGKSLTCIGNMNLVDKITVSFASRGIESTGDFYSQAIKGILGSKLVNKKTKKEINLICQDNGSRFFCEANLGLGYKLESGEYNFVAEEVISGYPVNAAIRATESKVSFNVIDGLYQPFPYSNFNFTAEFVKGKYNLEIEYGSYIYKPIKVTDGKKTYDCQKSEKEATKLICPLSQKDFPLGFSYDLSFTNICGQIEGHGSITTKQGESHETDYVGSYIVPFMVFAIVDCLIVALVIFILLRKKKVDKDIGKIVQTSYADEDKDRGVNEEEGKGNLV